MDSPPPVSAEDLKLQGNSHFKMKEYSQAIEKYTLALESSADNPSFKSVLYFNLGMANSLIDRTDESIANFTSAIELNPQYSKAIFQRMKLYQKLEKFDKAIEDAKILKSQHFTGANIDALILELEQQEKAKIEKLKAETLSQLKGLGNSILGKFGISLDNFKLNQNNDGSYNIQYKQ